MVVHDSVLARRTRNLIFVGEIGQSFPLDFEILPRSNNLFVALSKDLVRISYTTVDLVLSDMKVRGYSCKRNYIFRNSIMGSMREFDENNFTFDVLDSLENWREILAELCQVILDSPSPC
jgi:hypothetical protein